MFGLSCYIAGCNEQPLNVCSCCQDVYICQSHISNHLFLQGNQLWSKIVPWRAVKGG